MTHLMGQWLGLLFWLLVAPFALACAVFGPFILALHYLFGVPL